MGGVESGARDHSEGRVMARGGGRGNKRGGGAGGAAFTAEDIEARNRVIERKAEERRERRGDSDEDEDEDGGADKAAAVKFGPIDTGAGVGGSGSDDEGEDEKPRRGGAVGGEEKVDAKAAAHEAYMKRHLALETDEAKADMARLALVRQRRAEAAERKAAESEEAARAAEAKEAAEKKAKKGKKGKKGDGKEEPEFEALGKIAIKKMKPVDLKEALKERGLGIQGQKTELMQRLLEWEAETFGDS